MIDHTTCAPDAHDRSLPDDNDNAVGADRQAIAADGLLACNDCQRPAYYCDNDERYHHVDPDAFCFLIQD
jgi:hypothetical protein